MDPAVARRENAHDRIAQRAYELWKQRGCPWGSPQRDWFEAVQEVGEDAPGLLTDNCLALPFSDMSMGPSEM